MVTHHFPFLELCLKRHVQEVWVNQLVKVCEVLMGILVLHPENLNVECSTFKQILFRSDLYLPLKAAEMGCCRQFRRNLFVDPVKTENTALTFRSEDDS